MNGFNRRDFIKRSGLATAAMMVSSPLMAEEDQTRPNILFLLIDDQRNDTLGCAGNPIVKTPVIDSLAYNGVRFENAFVTTPICAASRASFFTGLHERTHGYTFGKDKLPLSNELMAKSYPMLLRNAGYRTGFIGKYGVKTAGNPEPEMFDYYSPHYQPPYFKKMQDGTERHEAEICGDKATKFLESNPKGKPFCLSVSFASVHAVDGDIEHQYPYPKAMAGMYDDVKMPPPRLGDPAIFENEPEFLRTSMNRTRWHWRWDTPEKYQKNLRNYYRMISGVDRVIGRIRKELERLKLADNTIIIYMGDNGYFMGDRGFAGKWSHYEQSLRVPLIVYDPRLPKKNRGVVKKEKVLNIDIPDTILSFAGVKVPDSYQGHSLIPILEGKIVKDWRNDFFCEHLMTNKIIPKWEGVRGERYVYACYFDQKPSYEFLHDLEKDPDELVNLASNPEYKEVLASMRKRCGELKAEYLKNR